MEENLNNGSIIPQDPIYNTQTGDTTSSDQSVPQKEEIYITQQTTEYFGTDDVNKVPGSSDIWISSIPNDLKYIWSRTINLYSNNTTETSTPILITTREDEEEIDVQEWEQTANLDDPETIESTEELSLEEELELMPAEEPEQVVQPPQDYETDQLYTSQAAIFNLLTENGTKEGIFFYEKDAQGNPVVDGDGTPHLYINMSYARSGVLQVGGKDNDLGVFMVLDENDHIVGQWDKKGIALQGGVIQSKDNSSWWNLDTGTLNLNGYITSYTKKYAIGTSQTTHPTSGWNTNPPDSVPEGSYLWQEATLKKTGSPDEVTYVCLGKTGRDGTNGIDGRDIVSINTQYRLSSSDVQLIGGSWSNAAPAYEKNKYYWTRVKVVYNDGNTEYNPDENGVVDLGLTTANRIADDAKEISNLAKSSADSAVADAQIAKQQATAAATSASNAATSASNAQSSASSAAASASSAQSNASNAATSASNAQSSASAAAESASNAQSSASSAATSASNAQASALAAAESASDAQTKASDAQSFASNAAQSAYDANLLASDAATSAQNANNSASTAAQSASNAADSASSASTAASNAQTLAGQAKTQAESAVSSANEAKTQAGQATTAANEAKTQAGQATSAAQLANQVANGAINSLSTVEDVMGTLTWIQQHGTYALTTDTTIEPGKHYFTRSGTSPNYTYSLVQNPTGNPSTNGYYELTGTDEAVSNYVSTHLALTDQGLFISTDGVDSQGQGTGYKLLLTGNNAQIIDNTGVVVSTYGQNITFNSYRPQRIGGDNVYLEYYDSNSDGRADAIRIQGDKVDIIGGHSIQSSNYVGSGNANSPYTSAGTYLDLTNGNFYTPNFGINSSSAYLNGEITAKSGRIGQSNANSYWKIGSIMDYNQQTSASLEAEGTAYIQIGNFQFSEGLLNTQKYTANRTITYLKQGSTYWDFGVQAPELDTTKTGYVAGVDDNFLYIRNHENTIPTLKTDWNYVFRVDKTGMVYINGVSLDNRYALKTDVGSTYLPVTGGTINGNLTVTGSINGTATKATQLSTARTLIADLSSITAGSFDGTSNVTLGISGTLGIGHGGTGKTYWTQYGIVYASTTSALSQLAVGTSGQVLTSGGNAAPGWTNQSSLAVGTATKWASAQKVYVTLGTASTTTTIQGGSSTAQTIGVDGTLGVGNGGTGATTFTSGAALIGNGTGAIQTRAIRNNTTQGALGWTSSNTDTTLITTNTLAYWNGAYQSTTSNLEYVKLGKLGTVVTHNIDEFITTAGGIIDGSLQVTDLTAGNLVVTGAGRFTNGLYGDLTGTATSVSNSLKIQLNSGTTEGTNQFTFNGSAAKTVNITKSSIGLGNVENTALSTYIASWTGSSNLTTTKVGTLAAAAAKAVDTSIGAGSTSANLPTSAAVASFVEGKGYVTSSGVTSVRVQATSPVVSSSNTAQSSTLNTTISLADAYGDTKNPYGTKNANVVLAGPASGSAAAPSFRALVAADIPTLAASKVGLGNLTNDKQVKGLASGTTAGHFVTWGANGYTVADSGYTAGQVVKTLASNNDGKLVLTYLDGTTSDPIEVKIIGSSGSSVSYADALNVNGTAVGSSTVPIYLDAQGKPKTANTIPSVTLNGSANNTPSFYAATGAGTSGQYLKSNGSGAPTWATFSKSTVGLGNVDNTADANKNVLTATKFASAQSVTLTGDTTGTASSQAGWSITTKTDRISTVGDKRAVATTPNDYTNKIIFQGLKTNSSFGSPSTDSYSYVIGLRGWSDSSGGNSHEIAFNNSGIFRRDGATTSWNAWEKMLDSGNYTDYTVTKTGTGASGSWGISITGNAATATKATQDGNGANIASTYAKLSGATFTGAINTANNTYNKIGNDVAIGDINTAGALGVKGLNGATKIVLVPYSGSTNNIISNDGAGNLTISGTTIGTFSGSLSGNASSATTATSSNRLAQNTEMTYGWSGINYFNIAATNQSAAKVNDTPFSSSTWTHILRFNHANNAGYYTDLAIPFNANSIYYKRISSGTLQNATTNGGWVKVLDQLNYTDYTVTKTGTGASGTWGIDITGNAATATKATQDGNGANIASTYAKLAGAAFTGAVTGTSFHASGTLAANTANSSTAGGIALYNATPTSYGIAMRGTGNGGKHGYVQGDWAIYNYMTASANVTNRGWVWNYSNSTMHSVASLSGDGNMVLNGSVTVGGNVGNTSGCRMEFNSATQSLDFVFA